MKPVNKISSRLKLDDNRLREMTLTLDSDLCSILNKKVSESD